MEIATGNHRQLLSRRGFLAGGATAGLASAGAVGLTGCGGSSSGGGRSSGTLTVAVNGTQAAAAAIQKAVAPPFLAAHPKIKLNFMAINGTDWNDYFAKILTLIAGGNAPDLTTVATEGLQLFAGKGLAEPLNSYVTNDKANLTEYFTDVHPVLIESMMYQGDLYVLPTDFNCGNMYLDTVLLDKAGVSYPAANWTKDDFYNMAQKWAGGSGSVGWDWAVRLWGSWTSWMYANNAVLAFAGYWNEFFRPLIFLSTPSKFTLPLGLVTLQGYLGTGSVSVVLAGVVQSLVPTLIIFLIAQRRLVEGLTFGSVKG